MKPNETTSKMEEEQAKTSVLDSETSAIDRDKGTPTLNFLLKVTNGKSSDEDSPKKLITENFLLVKEPQPSLQGDAMTEKVLLSSGGDTINSHHESIHTDTSFTKNSEHNADLKYRPQTDGPKIGTSFSETSASCEKKSKSDPKTVDEVLDCEEIQQTRKILVETERRQDLGQNSNKGDPSKHKKSPTPKTGQENASDNNVDSNSVGSSSSEVKRPDRKCKNLTKALMMLTYTDDYVFYDDSSVTRINNYHKESKPTSKRNQTKEPKKDPPTEQQPKPRSQDVSAAEGGKGKAKREAENTNEDTEPTEQPELQQESLAKNKVKGLKKRGRRKSTLAIKKQLLKPIKKVKSVSCEVSSKTESHTTLSQTTSGNTHRKLEDCLPDVIEPRSSRQPSRRSLEAEKCSAIIEHVIEGDRHFCCFSCLKYFASFHQFSDHKNSLVCVPGLLATSDQKTSNDVANHGSILTCNSYNACKSKTNRFDDSCDTEYSKFTSDAPGRIPEVTFNGMHGKLDHIESMDAQTFRSKLNLNDTEKYKMNINSPWTTKEVWESGGGWELSDKDYLSWHKYENRWSESRRFLMSMSHLPWSEQIKFKKVFDLAVSTKPLKKQIEDVATSDGLLKKFPGKKKHNSLIGAIGLRQTSKSAKYMSVNEREELKQKAIRQELVEQQAKDINTSRSNLNGEWERDHFFVCGACSEHFDDLGKAMSHKWDAHPYCLVAHVICQSELSEPPSGFTYPQTGRQLAPDRGVLVLPKRTSSNYARKASQNQSIKCTKCLETNFVDRNAFRIHILECGGLTNWNNPTTKKKKRAKRAKNIGNSKLIKRTHSRDGTESDDSSGTNNFNQAAALKRKQRFERFNQPPPMRDVGVGRFTRLQAVRIKSTSKRGRRRKIDIKQATKRDKIESDGTTSLTKPESISKSDDLRPKRLKSKRTHLVATPRPRRSVGNYTSPTQTETVDVKEESGVTDSEWKPIVNDEIIPTPSSTPVKELESLKTAKALMSDMLQKVEKAVQVVKKAEELNLSIDSVRGKMAELGSDRNRKRKSSVPTRLIFKTNDDPVNSQYFAKDEDVSVMNTSLDDDQVKRRCNENEEKQLPKASPVISSSASQQPDTEPTHSNPTPIPAPTTNDENVQPTNCREEADAERAKLEFVKDYLNRVALVQALTKSIMMRDSMTSNPSPTVASFIEARRSLLSNAAQQNFKTLTNKTQPDTQALIQTAQAQALFKAQMSNLYKPMGSAAFEATNSINTGEDNRKTSSDHLQPQLHTEPISSLTGVLKRLQKPSFGETLQSKDSSSSMHSLPTILTHQMQPRDSKSSHTVLSKESLTKAEPSTSSSLQPHRSLETHSDVTHSAIPQQPVDVHGVFSAAYSPLLKTDFQLSRSSTIKTLPESSPLSLLLMGRRSLGASPSNDFQLNHQVDCQPEDLSMKKKPFEEKKIQDQNEKRNRNSCESPSVHAKSNDQRPDTVRIIRVPKDDLKGDKKANSTNDLNDTSAEVKKMKELKDRKNSNKYSEEMIKNTEMTDQIIKVNEKDQKMDSSNLSEDKAETLKLEKSQRPKVSESIQTPQKEPVTSELREKRSDISKKLQTVLSSNDKKSNNSTEEKSNRNQKNSSRKIESFDEDQPLRQKKLNPKDQVTPMKKSPDTHEYDFNDEDTVSIEPMKRSAGRPVSTFGKKSEENSTEKSSPVKSRLATGSPEKSSLTKSKELSAQCTPSSTGSQDKSLITASSPEKFSITKNKGSSKPLSTGSQDNPPISTESPEKSSVTKSKGSSVQRETSSIGSQDKPSITTGSLEKSSSTKSKGSAVQRESSSIGSQDKPSILTGSLEKSSSTKSKGSSVQHDSSTGSQDKSSVTAFSPEKSSSAKSKGSSIKCTSSSTGTPEKPSITTGIPEKYFTSKSKGSSDQRESPSTGSQDKPSISTGTIEKSPTRKSKGSSVQPESSSTVSQDKTSTATGSLEKSSTRKSKGSSVQPDSSSTVSQDKTSTATGSLEKSSIRKSREPFGQSETSTSGSPDKYSSTKTKGSSVHRESSPTASPDKSKNKGLVVDQGLSDKQHKRVLSESQNLITPKKEVEEPASAKPEIKERVNAVLSPRKRDKLHETKGDEKITTNHLNGHKTEDDISNAKNEKLTKSLGESEQVAVPQVPRKRGRPPKVKVNEDPLPKDFVPHNSKKADVFDFQIDEDDDWSDSFRRPKKSQTPGSPSSSIRTNNLSTKDEDIIPTPKQNEPEKMSQSISSQESIDDAMDRHDQKLFQDGQNESQSVSRSSSHDDFEPDEDDFKPSSSSRRRSSFANSFYALMPMRKTLRRTAARISMERATEREALMNVLFDESDQSNDAEISHSEKPSDDELFNKLLNSELRINEDENKKSEEVISKSSKDHNGTPSTKEKKKRGRKPLSGKKDAKEQQSVAKPDPFDALVTSSKPKIPEKLPETNPPVKHSPRQKRKRFSSTPSTSFTSKNRNSTSYDDIAIYQAGLSVSEISKITGIPEELLELDRPKRSRRSVPVEMDANRTIYPLEVRSFAVDRIRSGVTQVQVARDLDCPVSTVASWWHKRKQIKLALDPNAVLSDSDDDSDIVPLKAKRSQSSSVGNSIEQKSKPGFKSKLKKSSKKSGFANSILKKKGSTKRQKSFSASASSVESFHIASDEIIDDEPDVSCNSDAKNSKVGLESKPPLKATATDGTESEDTDDDDDDDDDRGSAATVGIKNQILKHCFASMAARNNL